MSYVEDILNMITEALGLSSSEASFYIIDDLEWMCRRLGVQEQKEFEAAIVGLLCHSDLRVRAVSVKLCFLLRIAEARPVLANMLRDEVFTQKYGALLAEALDRAAVRQGGALLLKIVEHCYGSASFWDRRSPHFEASLRALARGNSIAAVPYLRPLFDGGMEHGFAVLPMGPQSYGFRNVIAYILREIILEYGTDGLQLVREVFNGIPAEREAYLRRLLEHARDRLREEDWYEEEPPAVPEDVITAPEEYIESLNPTTWFKPPVLPQPTVNEHEGS